MRSIALVKTISGNWDWGTWKTDALSRLYRLHGEGASNTFRHATSLLPRRNATMCTYGVAAGQDRRVSALHFPRQTTSRGEWHTQLPK